MGLQYTLRFGRHPAGDCRRGCIVTTLAGGNAGDGDRKYLIEYQGTRLDRLALAALCAHVASIPRTAVTEDRLERNPYTGGFRQVIQVVPKVGHSIRLRAWLAAGGRVVSEIWQYRVPPRG